MIYRPMGNTGLEVSALSMGGGHLPDDPEACDALLGACVDAGINYFETATFYCNGQCQQKIGRGLQPVRNKVMISAKRGILLKDEQPGCSETTADEYRREILDVQLPNLRTDHVEWLQVGWFTANKIETLRKKGGVYDAIRRMIDEKIVGHVGFTSHDTPENVIRIIETGLFESCTLQYNLLNRTYEPCLAAAQARGMAVVVMGPLAGGMLGRPELALRDLVSDAIQTTRAGLQFVLANPAVSTACSGMTTLEQLAENLASVSAPAGEVPSDEVCAIFDRFKAAAATLCTGCNYCRPCPAGVDISRNLRIRNYLAVYNRAQAARSAYFAIPASRRADRCTGCGKCEEKCPNRLPVRALLVETASACRA
mgnify:CR=1 FL=1